MDQNGPACYEIGWRSEDCSLIIGLDTDSLESYWQRITEYAERHLPKDTRKEAKMQGEFLTPKGSQSWGFGGAIEPIDKVKGFTFPCHQVKFPPVFWGHCYHDITALMNIASSLGTLFGALRFPGIYDGRLPIGPPKLAELYGFRLDFGCLYGSVLHATLYSPTLEYVESRVKGGERRLAVVEAAMLESHVALFPEDANDDCFFRDSFRAHVYENRISLSVVGNACGLDPIDTFESEPGTLRLSPHNTDSPHQQLELAVGVSALCDLVRKYQAKKPKEE